MVKQVEEFHGFLTIDMGRAVAQLVQIVKALDAYSKVGGSSQEGTPP
jgi:hypothetical protein